MAEFETGITCNMSGKSFADYDIKETHIKEVYCSDRTNYMDLDSTVVISALKIEWLWPFATATIGMSPLYEGIRILSNILVTWPIFLSLALISATIYN